MSQAGGRKDISGHRSGRPRIDGGVKYYSYGGTRELFMTV
jgi:hypothetical protein